MAHLTPNNPNTAQLNNLNTAQLNNHMAVERHFTTKIPTMQLTHHSMGVLRLILAAVLVAMEAHKRE